MRTRGNLMHCPRKLFIPRRRNSVRLSLAEFTTERPVTRLSVQLHNFTCVTLSHLSKHGVKCCRQRASETPTSTSDITNREIIFAFLPAHTLQATILPVRANRRGESRRDQICRLFAKLFRAETCITRVMPLCPRLQRGAGNPEASLTPTYEEATSAHASGVLELWGGPLVRPWDGHARIPEVSAGVKPDLHPASTLRSHDRRGVPGGPRRLPARQNLKLRPS